MKMIVDRVKIKVKNRIHRFTKGFLKVRWGVICKQKVKINMNHPSFNRKMSQFLLVKIVAIIFVIVFFILIFMHKHFLDYKLKLNFHTLMIYAAEKKLQQIA